MRSTAFVGTWACRVCICELYGDVTSHCQREYSRKRQRTITSPTCARQTVYVGGREKDWHKPCRSRRSDNLCCAARCLSCRRGAMVAALRPSVRIWPEAPFDQH